MTSLLNTMMRTTRVFRRSVLPISIALAVLAFPARAHQPASPPASSSQAPQSNGTQDQKPDEAPKRPDEAKKPDEPVGKSKLEQETGTVNDRLFEVLPNYGTVENSENLPPLSSGQKFRIATASVFDWASYPFNGALAAIAQAKNDPSSWGQGWGAYGKRYGASFADNSIGTYMTVAVFPSLLHEDPRYFQVGQGSFSHRAFYAMNRLFVTRKDSGLLGFNYSESVGNAAAAAISNIYHPAQDRTASRNASTFAFLILYDGLANELKEFWPDIRRKLLHKNNP
jgi:hypothetical protein